MDARYVKATTVTPLDVKVCGKRLLPFCLRHRVMLESIDSPFLDPDKKGFTAKDLMKAIRIISTYEKCALDKPFSIKEKVYIYLLNKSAKMLSMMCGFVLGHISNSCSYPKLWDKSENKEQEKVPWILSCVANNVRNGCSLEEAWTMPEGEAVWMSISHAIYNGAKIDVLSTDEEKKMEDFDSIIDNFKKSRFKN
jgi:hypothetical protein